MSRLFPSAVLAFLLLPSAVEAQEIAEGLQYAILIAVQQHDQEQLNLAYTLNDVEALKKVLMDRAGIPANRILELTDKAAPDKKPRLANLRREVPAFLKKVGKFDRVLVFFAGHGFLQGGKTYLVMADSKTEKLADTGLPANEIRDWLENTPAGVKFFIMDCCHAGGARNVPPPQSQRAEDVVALFKSSAVVVMGSCRSKEQSWEWNERRHGLYSYWLCRALEGGADANGDGRLTEAEVHSYVEERVRNTARNVLNREQSPVRMIGEGVKGVPVLLVLRPEAPESVCRRVAEHLDLEIRTHKLKKVGVLEFPVQPVGKKASLAASNLPLFFASRIQKALSELAGGAYQVLTEEQMKSTARGFKLEDISDPTATRKLSTSTEGLVTGLLSPRGQKLYLKCELLRTGDTDPLVTPSGVIPLSEDLLGDSGASFDNRSRPHGGPYDTDVVQHALNAAREPHPMLRDDFPFRLEVWTVHPQEGEPIGPRTTRKKKELRLVGKELFVPAQEGELFEIHVFNRYSERVAVQILVDGLNVIEQKRERIGQGAAFVIRPFKDTGKHSTIRGWTFPTDKVGKDGSREYRFRLFQFVEAANSVASRQGYGDAIGLITAAFYAEKNARDIGVGEGPEELRMVRHVPFSIGRLLGVVHLRYVDEKQLK